MLKPVLLIVAIIWSAWFGALTVGHVSRHFVFTAANGIPLDQTGTRLLCLKCRTDTVYGSEHEGWRCARCRESATVEKRCLENGASYFESVPTQ